MVKEDQIIELIADAAVQSTQQVIDLKEELTEKIETVERNLSERIEKLDYKIEAVEERLSNRIDKLDLKIDAVRTELKGEMRDLRNENLGFHDEIVGFLKRAEQERVFIYEHLRRHDVQIAELQRKLA